MSDNTFTFSISVADFDKSLLSPNARTPGTEEFSTAVSNYLQQQYRTATGSARIVVDDHMIRVAWNTSADKPDPLEVGLERLRTGDLVQGTAILLALHEQQPDDVSVLYNLGMALSEAGRLDEAEVHLGKLFHLAPNDVNTRVALGVVLARKGRVSDALDMLRSAVELDPANPWAQRNLGGCLLASSQAAEAEKHLRRAAELSPSDPQAWLGLGQACEAQDKLQEADAAYEKVISLDAHGKVGETARRARSGFAHRSFREGTSAGVRMDAVMYCLDALKIFAKMKKSEIDKIALEIALAGRSGLDPNDSARNHTLRSLPGNYSGLHMLCLMYVAFKLTSPEYDIRFDLSKEYAAAKAMADAQR
jgi:Flp pilus assembly protein TadD